MQINVNALFVFGFLVFLFPLYLFIYLLNFLENENINATRQSKK